MEPPLGNVRTLQDLPVVPVPPGTQVVQQGNGTELLVQTTGVDNPGGVAQQYKDAHPKETSLAQMSGKEQAARIQQFVNAPLPVVPAPEGAEALKKDLMEFISLQFDCKGVSF